MTDNRIHTPNSEITLAGVCFRFVRRRYGNRTFTWLHYQDASGVWQSYGDPWPSVRIPKADLFRIAREVAELGVVGSARTDVP
jgi:hypothetical protein